MYILQRLEHVIKKKKLIKNQLLFEILIDKIFKSLNNCIDVNCNNYNVLLVYVIVLVHVCRLHACMYVSYTYIVFV